MGKSALQRPERPFRQHYVKPSERADSFCQQICPDGCKQALVRVAPGCSRPTKEEIEREKVSSGKRTNGSKIPSSSEDDASGGDDEKNTCSITSPPSLLSLLLFTRFSTGSPAGNGVLGALQGRAQAEGLPDRLFRRDQDLLREVRGEYPVGEAVGRPEGA